MVDRADSLFPDLVVAEREPEPSLSYEQQLTIRRRQQLDRGVHPTTKVPLRQPVGEVTCGDCAHCVAKRLGKTYWKCDAVYMTGGPATDVRKSWPACERFEAVGPTPRALGGAASPPAGGAPDARPGPGGPGRSPSSVGTSTVNADDD